jgi:hypothetical protein
MKAWRNSVWLRVGIVSAVVISVGFYLWMSWRTLGLGFPLDDAWIHQSYARNLAQRGEWAFLPGRPSAGSTAPLWSAALALGHILGLDPRLWAYGLGAICLLATAWLCGRWVEERLGRNGEWFSLVVLLFAFEWHMVWAAVSGMEVLAIGLLAVVILWALEKRSWSPPVLGVLIGLGIWLRPEALLLMIPAIWVILTKERIQAKRVLVRSAGLLMGMALLVGPYLIFNRVLSGEWWPTTFYAKQTEYAVMREVPLLRRIIDQYGVPLVGVLALLLPGIVLGVVGDVRRRDWSRLAPLLWAGAHLGAYAWRLPLTYQHGRYAMPTIPTLLVLGLTGVLGWIEPGAKDLLKRVSSRAWLLSIVALTAGFWYMGARAYGQDVAIIESEMVSSSRWIAENTEADALIAAHDIGALGYFGMRDVLDLAGLVDPEVIPYIRDEAALEELLDSRHADYLMTFPNWYPELITRGEQLYSTEGSYSPAAGMENMAVYSWR